MKATTVLHILLEINLLLVTRANWTLGLYPWLVKPVWRTSSLNSLEQNDTNDGKLALIENEVTPGDRQSRPWVKDNTGLLELILNPDANNTSHGYIYLLSNSSGNGRDGDYLKTLIPVVTEGNESLIRSKMSDLDVANQNISPSKKIRSVSMDQQSDETCPDVTTARNTIEREVSRSIQVGGRFKNPWSTWSENSFRFVNMMRFGMSKDYSNIPSQKKLDELLPLQKPDFEEDSPSEGVRITWIGHSTILAQFDGFSVLTDPVFSQRASPSQYFGPKRYRNAPCTINDLPESLKAVVISHNHYDHLDVDSVTALNERYGLRLSWFVPFGLKEWFSSLGIKHAIEMDWWQEKCIPGNITVVFTPAQHWSKRGLSDDFTSLWGSWTLIGPKNRFFFTGDTGYCPVFKEIGDVYGPFDVAAIPIGAYEPRWFMQPQHVNPDEAALIHQDLKSRFSFAIHWGTFALANEYFLDPPVKLKSAMEKLKIPSHEFITMRHGESKVFPLDPRIQAEHERDFQLAVTTMTGKEEIDGNSFIQPKHIVSILKFMSDIVKR